VAGVIGSGYPAANSIFGLQCYIRSLKRLRAMASEWPELLVLPAHRLYSKDQWNPIGLGQRLDELLQHHIQRCAAILHILDSKPKTAEEIAREHFEERLLEGYGSMMAVNEVNSHCELLIESGDVTRIDGDKYISAEKNNFTQYIQDLTPTL
jgi:hypothetical protein